MDRVRLGIAFGTPIVLALAIFYVVTQHAHAKEKADGPGYEWEQFTRLIDSSGDPVWANWCAVSDTADSSEMLSCPVVQTHDFDLLLRPQRMQLFKAHVLKYAFRPRQLIRVNTKSPLSTDQKTKLVAEVLFNPTASDYIRNRILRSQDLSFSDALGKLNSNSPKKTMPSLGQLGLPKGSVVIKTMWAEIPATFPGSTVGITLSHMQGAPTNALILLEPTAPCIPSTAPAVKPVVPIGCFYRLSFDSEDVNHLGSESRIFSPRAAGAPPFDLLLLGFHVMVKEDTGWRWQTFWWDFDTFVSTADAAWKTRHEDANPLQIDDRWKHYVTDAIVPNDPYRYVFNPYLEGEFPLGRQSDCISCHRPAEFHPDDLSFGQEKGTIPDCYFQLATTAETGNAVPNLCPPTLKISDPGIMTDSLWSLADSNDTAQHTASQTAFDFSLRKTTIPTKNP